ncbi:hypothetical protein [Legionella tunisiensis]|uniref:hypothetical protein n=1 Tax=Legionella tunisiensis TaxID=1034944 RepID=UPI0003608200|nr:hypothetical protein [Legionella tunisiensis]
MRSYIAALIIIFATPSLYAEEYKVYWRCSDKHLEALEAQGVFHEKPIDLYVHYPLQSGSLFQASPINVRSIVNLPLSFNHENFLILGDKTTLLLNCVGQIILSPHYPQGKLVFDVNRNAYSCPLIPKDCNIHDGEL